MAKPNVHKDSVDLRDYLYQPSLLALPNRFLCACFSDGLYRKQVKRSAGKDENLFMVREQRKPKAGSGETDGSCAGQALAALVDIQRIEALKSADDGTLGYVYPASAAMAYAMAQSFEQDRRAEIHALDAEKTDGVVSLRSVLKGFYNCGLATDEKWNFESKRRLNFEGADALLMKEARNLTLGTYFRLEKALNHYHSALCAAGGLLVSAHLHQGWNGVRNGIIAEGGARTGEAHAFVIIGYDETGFLILNSYGPDWGGFNRDGEKLPGVAHWSYDDWHANIIDAWVLRLAVPTPDAFRISHFRPGSPVVQRFPEPPSSVPRMNVIGRYLTFADGYFRSTGNFTSSLISLKETIKFLHADKAKGEDRAYTSLVLVLHGDIQGTANLMARIDAGIERDKAQKIFRIGIDWINDSLEGASTALMPLFQQARARVNVEGDDCDTLIETLTRPIGRAVWRNMKAMAERCTRKDGKPGEVAKSISLLLAMARAIDMPVHLIAEGAGAHLLAALARRPAKALAWEDAIASVTFVSAMIGTKAFERDVMPFLRGWSNGGQRRATVFVTHKDFEAVLRIMPYTGSWSTLVQQAFEERDGQLMSQSFDASSIVGFAECVKTIKLRKPEGAGFSVPPHRVMTHECVEKHITEVVKQCQ
jgi:hypothetical protein